MSACLSRLRTHDPYRVIPQVFESEEILDENHPGGKVYKVGKQVEGARGLNRSLSHVVVVAFVDADQCSGNGEGQEEGGLLILRVGPIF